MPVGWKMCNYFDCQVLLCSCAISVCVTEIGRHCTAVCNRNWQALCGCAISVCVAEVGRHCAAVLSAFVQEKCYIALNMNNLGCNHVGSHSTRAEQDLFMTEQEHTCHRILVAALVHDVINTDSQTQNGTFFLFVFWGVFLTLAGNLGHLTLVIKAEQPQRAALPILSACAVFSCVQTMVCLPACGIFNKHTDVYACNCIWGLHGHRKRVCTGS